MPPRAYASVAPPFAQAVAALGSAPAWLTPSALLLIGASGLFVSKSMPKGVLAPAVLPRGN